MAKDKITPETHRVRVITLWESHTGETWKFEEGEFEKRFGEWQTPQQAIEQYFNQMVENLEQGAPGDLADIEWDTLAIDMGFIDGKGMVTMVRADYDDKADKWTVNASKNTTGEKTAVKKETREYDVYEFSELSKEAQEKAIEKFREVNVEDPFWSDAETDLWEDDLKALGYGDVEVFYSGFGSQGDGACFTTKGMDIAKYLSKHPDLANKVPTTKEFPDNVFVTITHSGMYYHAHSTEVYVEWEDSSELGEDGYEKLGKESVILDEYITADRFKLSNQIYKALEESYRYSTSDEAVKDFIESNEIKFFEDGREFNL